jgi:Bacteriophage baseplate protein W
MARSPFLPREPLGWPLLPVPDAAGTLRWPDLDQSVRQTIRAILMTRPGEWLLARAEGVGLADYLHAPNTAVTRRRLSHAIAAALGRLETRIKLDAIEVAPTGAREDEIAIRIAYRIKRTGAPGSVSVTMSVGN